MLKQQDMTETARVVFNELSVTEPATVGEIAQNTYLSRERCQLILTQLVLTSSPTFALRDSGGGFPLVGDG
ncbi:TrmB family transcriptional regulator [Escherichia coli]|uniref:Putative bacteriophage protein n=1 Tax=Escherichia coli TA447 TaxID=656447 RepID=A0A1X3IZA8_ECOLX|nr:TrmB family transcriptional regulator [Escherichia coli]OSK93169.1 putative bacteriophage protein [Escherichia coli TA447]